MVHEVSRCLVWVVFLTYLNYNELYFEMHQKHYFYKTQNCNSYEIA